MAIVGERKAPEREKPKTWRGNPVLWNLLTLLSPLVILFSVQLITLQEGGRVAEWAQAAPGMVLVTYLVLLACQQLITSITGSLFFPVLLLSLCSVGLALVSHLKERMNGSPLLISDLAMVGHAGDIASFLVPDVELGRAVRVALGLLGGLLLLIGLLAPGKAKVRRWRGRHRICVGLCCILFMGVTLWPKNAGAFLGGREEETQAERNERLGLLAGLYAGLLASQVAPPNAYTEDNMNQLVVEAGAHVHIRVPARQPHVVLLMSESFCDPSVMLPQVTFQSDPIPNYHRLTESFPSGDFLSNTYAGGTGNVEMEVLTGIPLGLVGEGEDLTSLRDPAVYDRIPSIVRAFRSQGYATEFVHSYTDRLYQRSNHLPRMGYEKTLFASDFPADAQRDGPYLTDLALAEKMISEFEGRDRSRPLFLFGLSMENHQPYFTDKFDGPSGLKPASDKLTTGELGVVDALAQGLNGADAGLGALVDYFSDCEEPVLLVFWGDHLPGLSLGQEAAVYSKLGYVETVDTNSWDAETMKKMHTTPYLVWSNFHADLEVPNPLSALTLGAKILEWAGAERPLFFEWNALAAQETLLYRQRLFVDGDGVPYQTIPQKAEETMDAYRNLVYDLLYGEGYVSEEMAVLPSQQRMQRSRKERGLTPF